MNLRRLINVFAYLLTTSTIRMTLCSVTTTTTTTGGLLYSALRHLHIWFDSYLGWTPSPPLNNIRVMVIVWRLRGNISRTALCWIVWHSVHSQQHTYMSSSYRSNRLGFSHWNPYAVLRGGCLELCYCNMVEWFWWDSSLIFDDQLVSFSALILLVWSSGL